MPAWSLTLADTTTPSTLTMGGAIGPYMLAFFLAFIVSIVATPFMRMLAIRYGIIDWPDLKRKAHSEPVAYLGGIALFLGWFAGVAGLFLFDPDHALDDIQFRIPIIIGALVVTIAGLWDDVYGVSPRVKMGFQLFAAAALAWGGVATGLVSDSLELVKIHHVNPTIAYILATAFIALLVVGACNAMNLLDGLDGLATGVAIIAAVGFLFIAADVTVDLAERGVATGVNKEARIQMGPIIVMSLALLGALLGFLPYNFNPANIFMGDAGSLLLGYLCAANILMFANVPRMPLPDGGELARGPLFVMAGLIVFGLPICDTALAIFRRKMRGQPIFSPDNQHMHHLLIRAGFGVKRAVLILYALAAAFALLGYTMAALGTGRFVLAAFLVVFGFVMVTAYKVGHIQVMREREKNLVDMPLPESAVPTTPSLDDASSDAKTPDVATS